jgi:hypothetical protein
MDKRFNGVTVETNGVRSIAGGGTGATTAAGALAALGGIAKNTSDETPVNSIRVLTQGQYTAVQPKDPNTLYFIKQ